MQQLYNQNCSQTAADGDVVIIGILQKFVIALSNGTIADPSVIVPVIDTTYRLATTPHDWHSTVRNDS